MSNNDSVDNSKNNKCINNIVIIPYHNYEMGVEIIQPTMLCYHDTPIKKMDHKNYTYTFSDGFDTNLLRSIEVPLKIEKEFVNEFGNFFVPEFIVTVNKKNEQLMIDFIKEFEDTTSEDIRINNLVTSLLDEHGLLLKVGVEHIMEFVKYYKEKCKKSYSLYGEHKSSYGEKELRHRIIEVRNMVEELFCILNYHRRQTYSQVVNSLKEDTRGREYYLSLVNKLDECKSKLNGDRFEVVTNKDIKGKNVYRIERKISEEQRSRQIVIDVLTEHKMINNLYDEQIDEFTETYNKFGKADLIFLMGKIRDKHDEIILIINYYNIKHYQSVNLNVLEIQLKESTKGKNYIETIIELHNRLSNDLHNDRKHIKDGEIVDRKPSTKKEKKKWEQEDKLKKRLEKKEHNRIERVNKKKHDKRVDDRMKLISKSASDHEEERLIDKVHQLSKAYCKALGLVYSEQQRIYTNSYIDELGAEKSLKHYKKEIKEAGYVIIKGIFSDDIRVVSQEKCDKIVAVSKTISVVEDSTEKPALINKLYSYISNRFKSKLVLPVKGDKIMLSNEKLKEEFRWCIEQATKGFIVAYCEGTIGDHIITTECGAKLVEGQWEYIKHE